MLNVYIPQLLPSSSYVSANGNHAGSSFLLNPSKRTSTSLPSESPIPLPLISRQRHLIANNAIPTNPTPAPPTPRAPPTNLHVPPPCRKRLPSAPVRRHNLRLTPSTLSHPPEHPPDPHRRGPRLLLHARDLEARLLACLQLLPRRPRTAAVGVESELEVYQEGRGGVLL